MRGVVGALGLGAIIVAAAVLVDDRWLGRRATLPFAAPVLPAPPLPRVAPPAKPTFALRSLEGAAAIRRGNVWTPATPGSRLATGDVIRTERGGSAVLVSPSGHEVILRERVELEIESLDTPLLRLALARGRVRAATSGTATPLEISAGDVAARGGPGSRFQITRDSRDTVTVAGEGGDVAVSAAGERRALPPDRLAVARKGGRLGRTLPIPDDVFLSVRWPRGVSNAESTVLRGRAEVGTLVTVNGVEAPLDADGTFRIEVVLSEGINRIEVSAEGTGGAREVAEGSIERRTAVAPPPTAAPEADPSRLYDPPRP